MNPIVKRILEKMQDDEVYETYPLSGICKAADLPAGYCGEAYHRDDPRLIVRLEELLEDGWTLPE